MYDGSQITRGALAVFSPLLIPATLPFSKRISSTVVFNMYVPPWIAQSLEKASGSPPRPYTGYKNGLSPYLPMDSRYNWTFAIVSAAGF